MRSPDPDAALEALLAEHGELLRRAIACCCPAELAAAREDIEQEARLRLWKALEGGTILERPASFVYRVAMTATLDAWRRWRARREEALDGPARAGDRPPAETAAAVDAAPSPEQTAAARELGGRIRSALSRLVETRRLAVELHLQGLSVPEVALATGWTEPAARKLVYRGLADLREELRNEGIEGSRA